MSDTSLRRTATVQIFTGDYLDRLHFLEAQHESLTTQLDNAVKREARTTQLAGETLESVQLADDLDKVVTAHQKLSAEAKAAAIGVTLQALRRKTWRELVDKHPPRTDVAADMKVGVNEDTFKEALVAFINPSDQSERTIIDGLTVEDLDDLADIDFDRLYFMAFALNRTMGASPKALDLPESPTNDATLN